MAILYFLGLKKKGTQPCVFSFPCYKILFLVESLSFNYKSICITRILQITHSKIPLSHVCFVWECCWATGNCWKVFRENWVSLRKEEFCPWAATSSPPAPNPDSSVSSLILLIVCPKDLRPARPHNRGNQVLEIALFLCTVYVHSVCSLHVCVHVRGCMYVFI